MGSPFATIACCCWPGSAFDEFYAEDKVRYQLLFQRTMVGPRTGKTLLERSV